MRVITRSDLPRVMDMKQPPVGSIVIYMTRGEIVGFSRRKDRDSKWVFPGAQDAYDWPRARDFIANGELLLVMEP